MSVAAYYLTLLVGTSFLVLSAYGIFNDIKNNSPPRTLMEWSVSLAITLVGVAMCLTAMQAIIS